jgi:hypothetical protein
LLDIVARAGPGSIPLFSLMFGSFVFSGGFLKKLNMLFACVRGCGTCMPRVEPPNTALASNAAYSITSSTNIHRRHLLSCLMISASLRSSLISAARLSAMRLRLSLPAFFVKSEALKPEPSDAGDAGVVANMPKVELGSSGCPQVLPSSGTEREREKERKRARSSLL